MRYNPQHFGNWLRVNKDILKKEFAKFSIDKEIDFDFEYQAFEVYQACQGNNLKHIGNFSTYFGDGQYISAQSNFKIYKENNA